MQRPSLRHPLTSSRHPAPGRAGRIATLTHRRGSAKRSLAKLEAPLTPPEPAAGLPLDYDYAARRVRDAGGPIDEATYSCSCGYVFAASVTTSVCCPHCGAHQAW